ncbi:MAG TPA: hypothetical protein VJ914_08485 [Pseudonocardiaceae bacterium]|nr:hypothetical protein [Pseudonocardiaceae bacterium]
MPTRLHVLAELASAVRCVNGPIVDHWSEVNRQFQDWVGQPGLRAELKSYLSDLSSAEFAALIGRSRETTTHFAWCLFAEADDPFSVWLHEYKPQRDWREGYADSVHNHRYHFCTNIISGAYTHERFAAELDATTNLISAVRLLRGTVCPAGTGGFLLADEFHRIPAAEDGTMTLLVKSREVRAWSLSYDPMTHRGYRHIPVENRLDDLVGRL